MFYLAVFDSDVYQITIKYCFTVTKVDIQRIKYYTHDSNKYYSLTHARKNHKRAIKTKYIPQTTKGPCPSVLTKRRPTRSKPRDSWTRTWSLHHPTFGLQARQTFWRLAFAKIFNTNKSALSSHDNLFKFTNNCTKSQQYTNSFTNSSFYELFYSRHDDKC